MHRRKGKITRSAGDLQGTGREILKLHVNLTNYMTSSFTALDDSIYTSFFSFRGLLKAANLHVDWKSKLNGISEIVAPTTIKTPCQELLVLQGAACQNNKNKINTGSRKDELEQLVYHMGIFSAPGKNGMSVGSDAETAWGGRLARGLTGSLRCSPGIGNLGRCLRVR